MNLRQIPESQIPADVVKEMDAIAKQARGLKISTWDEVFASLVERNHKYLFALYDDDICEMSRIKASTRLIVDRRRYFDFIESCRDHAKVFGLRATAMALLKLQNKKLRKLKKYIEAVESN